MTNEDSKLLDEVMDRAGWRSFMEHVNYKARLAFGEASDIAKYSEEIILSLDIRVKELIGHKAR